MTNLSLLDLMLNVATEGDEAGIAAAQDALRELDKHTWADFVRDETSPIRQRKMIADLAESLWKGIELEIRTQIRSSFRAIRDACHHPREAIYHPDPSGNNGSWRECPDCGAEV